MFIHSHSHSESHSACQLHPDTHQNCWHMVTNCLCCLEIWLGGGVCAVHVSRGWTTSSSPRHPLQLPRNILTSGIQLTAARDWVGTPQYFRFSHPYVSLSVSLSHDLFYFSLSFSPPLSLPLPLSLSLSLSLFTQLLLLLLPGMSFPFLQGLLGRVLGLLLIDLLEHHKIDPLFSVYQFILKK